MAYFGSISKTPYDIIADEIEKWCLEHYYSSFLVTLRINGEICVEYLLYMANLDTHWAWESDWWEGQKDIELIGFIDISSVRVSGTPDNYKFITIEKT